MNAFYYEGSGGDSGEISIASGAIATHNTSDFSLLQSGVEETVLSSLLTPLQTAQIENATVSIKLTGVNDTPNAVNDFYTINEAVDGSPSPNTLSNNVLTNDTDIDGDAPTFSVVEVEGDPAKVGNKFASTYGWLELNSDGSFTYTLDDANLTVQSLQLGQTLRDVFSYKMSDNHVDGNVKTDTATLTIDIDGQNDSVTANDDPTVISGVYTVSESGTLTIDVADGLFEQRCR